MSLSIAERVARVEERIQAACQGAGRSRDEITLVAVSKRQPLERIRATRKAGIRIFGESRVQEAEEKLPRLPEELVWHFVGPLQSNKVKRAVELFRTFHAVDREKIARYLDREAEKRGLHLRGFLEVNVGQEESKHGFAPDGFVERVAGLVRRHENLELVGLMAIPPLEEDPERTRHWFRKLRELRDELATHPDWSDFPGLLSMGMSDDFEIAIEEGATHIRVGTALFGSRID
ncbi:MAG: YggS family pyridoxal phosphate-dependent enzyme [Thermoanaerobaculia bacterium]|nr:YggS family pyridoxal phosphate-dependent enzyme [Thermoanaerobaculia bacterium]